MTSGKMNQRTKLKIHFNQHWSQYHANQARRFRDEAQHAKSTAGQQLLRRCALDHQAKAHEFSEQAMSIAGVQA